MDQKNEKMKFVVPLKSCRVVKKGKKCAKENYSESPKTPQRIATFTLYGVKSPYRSSKPSEKPPGKRFSFISSQVSTPGKSPGQLIKNFRQKIERETNGEKITTTDSFQSTDQTKELSPLKGIETGRSRKVQQHKDIYDLDNSPDFSCRNRKEKREELIKHKVLHLIAKMSSEFHEFKKRHKKLRATYSAKGKCDRKNVQQCVPNTHKQAHTSTLKQRNFQSTNHNIVRTRHQNKVVSLNSVADENSPPFEPMEE